MDSRAAAPPPPTVLRPVAAAGVQSQAFPAANPAANGGVPSTATGVAPSALPGANVLNVDGPGGQLHPVPAIVQGGVAAKKPRGRPPGSANKSGGSKHRKRGGRARATGVRASGRNSGGLASADETEREDASQCFIVGTPVGGRSGSAEGVAPVPMDVVGDAAVGDGLTEHASGAAVLPASREGLGKPEGATV